MNDKNIFDKVFIIVHIISVTSNKCNDKILYFKNKKFYINIEYYI